MHGLAIPPPPNQSWRENEKVDGWVFRQMMETWGNTMINEGIGG